MSSVAYRTCPLCEATCGLAITIEDASVKVIRGDRDNVFSKGFLCPKGTTLGRLHDDPDRLRVPMIKQGGAWEEASWEEAFALIDDRYTSIVSQHGRHAAGLYLGNPNVHSLDNALASRPLAKALGTVNLFSASTVDQMPKHVSAGFMFGHPFAIPVPDIDRTDHLLILGANPYESNGSLATAPDWPGRLEALRARGGTVVVVDPRRTKTAANADRWVPVRPGTDAALLVGMIAHLVRSDRCDLGNVAGMVDGLDRLRDAVGDLQPAHIAHYCGVDEGTIESVADGLADAASGCVYGRIGTHTVSFGTVASWAVDVLNVITGNLDRPGGAMFPMTAAGPRTRNPRPFATGRWRSRVKGMPEVLGELPAVTLTDEILTEGAGRLRMLFTVAGNPALTNPDAERLDQALRSLDFMVSVDPYLNETTRHADVILPPPSHLERPHFDVAFTGLSVRNYAMFSESVFDTDQPSEFEILVRLTAIVSGAGTAIDPAAVAWRTMSGAVGRAADAHGVEAEAIERALGRWADVRKRILDLMIRTGAYGDGFGSNPEGLTLQKLIDSPHGMDLGPLEPRAAEVVTTASGMIDLAPQPIIDDLERLRGDLAEARAPDMVLVGRRQLRTANSWLGNIEVLVKGKRQCTLEMHRVDADRLGVNAGDTVTVTSTNGTLDVEVDVTESIKPGVVSLPYGWGHDVDGVRLSVASRHPGVNINRLTTAAEHDPVSGNAVLNGIAVAVTPRRGRG